MGTVRIKERSLQIDDLLAAPHKNKSWLFGYFSNGNCFKIFLRRVFKESVYVLFCNDNCHPLLRLGNCKFRTVKSGVFLRNFIKIHPQPISKFSDSNRNTACAKIITFTYKFRNLGASEQPLELTLGGSVTFLYFGSACFNRRCRMRLG